MAKIADGVDWIHHCFSLTPDHFKAIVHGFKQECKDGLSTPSAIGLATMIPSYVTRLPTGNETGTYLALDLGGSTLRVSAVRLLGHGQVQVTEVRKLVSSSLRTSTADAFFDWIADNTSELLAQIPPQEEDRPVAMGVCWSFPLDQTSICKGTILRMGKGFLLADIEGQDLATLFHRAFRRKRINVVVTALVNDTIGTLVAHAYSNPNVRVGFIYGTGVNAAYPEKISRIIKLNVAEWQDASTEMLVNTEIDIFGSGRTYLPLTPFDRALDANHPQPGFQPYEKMMSGACLGELVRLIAVDLIQKRILFDGVVPPQLATPWQFQTANMSDIEGVSAEALPGKLQAILDLPSPPSDTHAALFLRLCVMVATRAAGLAAAAIAAMIEQQTFEPDQDIVVGINGSTYELYPHMAERIQSFLVDWFGEDIGSRIQLEVAHDGGSIGAALVAMLYSSKRSRKNDPGSNASHIKHTTVATDAVPALDMMKMADQEESTSSNHQARDQLPSWYSCFCCWRNNRKRKPVSAYSEKNSSL
ncbi:hypothetical protein BX666DRAFT_2018157 [Dichotomocladium elegans]|nr:hypothetical protein BX666DRAFT_2018157 [Dichotomocladium elegans]